MTPSPPWSAPDATSTIVLEGVDKRFASGLEALRGVSLQVRAGEFVALVGPSGCGKSTVLRMAAGLEAPTAGTLVAPALRPTPGGRTAFVFQEPTLMPWASVFDNVWLPLRLNGVSRQDATERVRAVLAGVDLGAFENALPGELSGGMKMRCSIARALVTEPELLLMDEPFAALDELTRQRLGLDLMRWWQDRGMGVLFVTHSVAEAVFLSQRVMVMSPRPGRIVHSRPIAEPYPRPAGFRHSNAFLLAVRELSEAMSSAMEPGPSAAA